MVSCCFIQSVLAIWITLAFGVCLFQESLCPHDSLDDRLLDQSCWGVRDSRRDVNALLDDFKNSHEHFFKCLAGSWGVVLRCLTNECKSLYISLKTLSVFVLFQFYVFFCWMNLGHQGWAFAMVTRHSFRNRWFQNGAGNLWAAFVAAPLPSSSGFLCITATTVNQFRLWMSLGDSEFVSVILNSKLIISIFFISFHSRYI